MFMLAQITTNIHRKLYSELSAAIYIVCCAQAESKRGEKGVDRVSIWKKSERFYTK
jgi:hypothetical protein